MGLRIAILIAVVGALALAAVVGFANLPHRRRPRAMLAAVLIALLGIVTAGVFLVPAAPTTPAPVDDALTIYYSGQDCQPVSFFAPTCSGGETLHALRAQDGTLRWRAQPPSLSPQGTPVQGPPSVAVLFTGRPVLANRLLYRFRFETDASGPHFILAAARASDGVEVWHVSVNKPAPDVEVADGNLYIFSPNGPASSEVLVLRANDGAEVQRAQLPAGGPFALVDGVIYACQIDVTNPATFQTSLLAIRASDTHELWHTTLQSVGFPGLGCDFTVSGAVVYITPIGRGEVAAVRTSDGNILWRTPAEDVAEVAVSGDTVLASVQPSLVPSDEGKPTPGARDRVLALRASDGSQLWERTLDASATPTLDALTVAGDVVYVGGAALTALHVSDGSPLWRRGGGGYGEPVVVQGVVFVQAAVEGGGPSPQYETRGAQILALGASEGQFYWQVAAQSGGIAVGTP
jgi:outer membrane protein assembly factor BamB